MYSFYFDFPSKGGDDLANSVSESRPGVGKIVSQIDPDYRTYGTLDRFLSKFRVFDYYDMYDYETYDYRSINGSENYSNCHIYNLV